jgi:hypothetical protein
MEPSPRSRKALFVFVWAVGWGGSTALVTTFLDWHRTRRLEPHSVAAHFVIFMSGGVFLGLWLWNNPEKLGHKKLTRAQTIVRSVLFVALMLGLLYLAWRLR